MPADKQSCRSLLSVRIVLYRLNFQSDLLSERSQFLHVFANPGSGSLVVGYIEFLEILFKRGYQLF